jgi:uncharacterized protein YegP (UPF0339 family)
MIQIHDSKKKGDYLVKIVSRNGKQTQFGSGYSSKLAVNKTIESLASEFRKRVSIKTLTEYRIIDLRDHTTEGYWAKKYGCRKGKPTNLKK